MLHKVETTEEVYHLPEFFAPGMKTDMYCKHYVADADAIKTRIIYSDCMIGFPIRGEKEIFVGSRHEVVHENNILLLQSGSVIMTQRLNQHQQFESLLFFFNSTFLSKFIEKHHPGSATSFEAQSIFVLPKDVYMQQFQQSVLHLNASPTDPFLQVKLEELLYLLKKHPQQMACFFKQSMGGSSQQKVHQLVLQSLDKNLTIEELAFLYNMSVSTFKRVFQEVFHNSPKRYFIERKMDRAKQYLMQQKRISEIYTDLGYESFASFSTEFKKQVGMSPKQFQSKFELKQKVFEP